MVYQVCKVACALYALIVHPFSLFGANNIPKEGGGSIVSNHQSNWDPLILTFITYRIIHFLGKIELFKNAFLKWAFTQAYVIPVDRERVKPRTILDCMKILKEGHLLGIFPEGTRIRNNKKAEISNGFVLFAIRTKTPIIPVHISGNPKPFHQLKVVVGEPIYLTEYYGKKVKDEKLTEIAREIMDKIYLLN